MKTSQRGWQFVPVLVVLSVMTWAEAAEARGFRPHLLSEVLRMSFQPDPELAAYLRQDTAARTALFPELFPMYQIWEVPLVQEEDEAPIIRIRIWTISMTPGLGPRNDVEPGGGIGAWARFGDHRSMGCELRSFEGEPSGACMFELRF